MAATQAIDTPKREGNIFSLPVAAATKLFAGILAAVNAAGNLVQAVDAPGLKVVGRVLGDVDNSAGDAGALSANVERGVFKFANSGDNAVTAAHLLQRVYVEDEQTVASDPGDHGITAGVCVGVDDDGVWVDTSLAPAPNLTPVAVVLGNADNEIGGLTVSDPPTQAEVVALRGKCEELADDVRALKAALDAQGITS